MVKNVIEIFLSYAREDKRIAERIYDDLCRLDLKIWLDRETIKIGQQWENEIKNAIRKSDYFLVLISSHSILKKSYVQTELKEAFKILSAKKDTGVFIIPVRIEECSIHQKKFNKLNWIDLFPENKYAKGIAEILKLVDPEVYILRNKPAELSESEALKMIRKHDFYDDRFNPYGKGIFHRYKKLEIKKESVILDDTTKLTWQQGGSEKRIPFSDASYLVKKLNDSDFAGYHDWRLPTLEEAMSLIESQRNQFDLFIDPIFNTEQEVIWTSDSTSARWGKPTISAWRFFVSFKYGCYSYGGLYHLYEPGFVADSGITVEEAYKAEEEELYIRAVRSGILPIDEENIEEEKKAENENEDIPF